jgi:uncharacterized protein (TIGR00251 family)
MDESGCTLRVKVTPGAKKNEVIGFLPDGTIRVKIIAPPVEGKANMLLVKWIAEIAGIKPSKIEIIHGEKSRTKVLRIEGLSSVDVIKRISTRNDSM